MDRGEACEQVKACGFTAGTDYALLTDRVLLAQGKQQRYGSQFVIENGKWIARPIEDPTHVDQRRAELGMMSLTDYSCSLEALHPLH